MSGWLRAGGVFLILVGLAAVGRLWSQDKSAPPGPRTRVALINLTYVISNYDKYKAYKAEMKAEAGKYEERIKEIQAQMAETAKEFQNALPDKRDDIEKKQKQLQNEAEALTKEGKTALGKEADKQMVLLYKEVQTASERYAKTHDLELVMHYNEPLEEAELDTPANVGRKMQAGACVPLYAAPGIDASKEVLALLQENVQKDK